METDDVSHFAGRERGDSGVSLISHNSYKQPGPTATVSLQRFLHWIAAALIVLCASGLLAVILLRLEKVEDSANLNRQYIADLRHQLNNYDATIAKLRGKNARDSPSPEVVKKPIVGAVRSTLPSWSSRRLPAFPLLKDVDETKGNQKRNITALKGFGNSREFIHVVGKGNAQSEIRARESFHHWTVAEQTGRMFLTAGTHIHVEVPGLYFVYCQVQFLMTAEYTQYLRSVVYCVTRNENEVLARSIVPVKNCNATCTRYQARLVKLRRGDWLSVQVLQDVQIITRAPATYFGAFLVLPSK